MKKSLPILLSICSFGATLSAQTYTLQSNHVKATIHVDGAVFTDGQSGKFIPVQSGLPELSLLNGSGIWIACKDAGGTLKGAVERLGSTDFTPGVLDPVSGENISRLLDIWPVTCADLAQTKHDFEDNGLIDNPNPRVFAFPGKGNPFFTQYNPAAPNLPFTIQALASFYDLNLDAVYNPEYGDLPSADIRGCAGVFANELAWSVFNDRQAGPHPSGLSPVGMEIQRDVFVLAVPGSALLDNTVFVKYKLINRSTEVLDSCVVGLYSDIAIGNQNDDFIGSIPGQMVFAYNGDGNDENGFGMKMPVLGIQLLRGPLAQVDSFNTVELDLSSALAIPDPAGLSASEIYNLMKGRQADGSAGPDGGFVFPGDPNLSGAQSEIAAGSTPGKRRILMNTGPFTLLPGAVNEFIVAYHYAYAEGASSLESISTLLENAQNIRALFDNCFDATEPSCSAVLEAPEETKETGFSLYPNPAAQNITIESKDAPFSNIEIRDMLGRSIHQITLPAGTKKWDVPVGQLPAATYWVRVDNRAYPVVIQR